MALQSKVEQAFASLLTTAFGEAVNIYMGKSIQEKASPCVTVIAEDGNEEPLDTGNYLMAVRIETCFNPSNQTDPFTDSNTLVDNVKNAINTDTLAADLTAAVEDFTCMEKLGTSIKFGPHEDVWQDILSVDLYCCEADL